MILPHYPLPNKSSVFCQYLAVSSNIISTCLCCYDLPPASVHPCTTASPTFCKTVSPAPGNKTSVRL
ncbi:hypothetical protein IRJ41_022761 [Triplophysa rosa]|uniref:Uncharacterized protein n=1 Tax=Triplophysa rosa TaxID=992332 RepID=A0A9W7WRX0_TRIRA|nr:hypothetical protein IRJ41_022761 [Triplophysa rosa]